MYVGGSGNLYALDEQTGRTLWTQQVNGDYSPPTLMGSRIFVAYIGHQFDAFSAYDGKLLWNPPGTGTGGGGDTVAAYRGRIYAHEDGQTLILDARKGRVVGRLPCGTIPAFRGSTGFFLCHGRLTGLDLPSLRRRWSFSGDGALVSAPLVAGDAVFVASAKGHLYAIRPADGKLLATADLGAPAAAPDEAGGSLTTGMNAGEGVLVVSLADRIEAFG